MSVGHRSLIHRAISAWVGNTLKLKTQAIQICVLTSICCVGYLSKRAQREVSWSQSPTRTIRTNDQLGQMKACHLWMKSVAAVSAQQLAIDSIRGEVLRKVEKPFGCCKDLPKWTSVAPLIVELVERIHPCCASVNQTTCAALGIRCQHDLDLWTNLVVRFWLQFSA